MSSKKRKSKPEKKQPKPTPIEVVTAPDCRVLHVSGVIGSVTLNEGTLMVYTETPTLASPKGITQVDRVEREIGVILKMSPFQWQSIIRFMQQRLQLLEKRIGALPKPEKQGDEPPPTYVG